MSERTADRKGHPSLADLDAVRTREAPKGVLAHVEACDECRRLAEELRALAGEVQRAVPAPPVSEFRFPDDAIGRAIRERATEIEIRSARRRRIFAVSGWGWRMWSGAAAVAAAAVLVALMVLPTDRDRQEAADAGASAVRATAATPSAPEVMDVDGSGVVDIVDAWMMSKRLMELANKGDEGNEGDNGEKAPATWDFNCDGTVDRADADAVAMAAVSL